MYQLLLPRTVKVCLSCCTTRAFWCHLLGLLLLLSLLCFCRAFSQLWRDGKYSDKRVETENIHRAAVYPHVVRLLFNHV